MRTTVLVLIAWALSAGAAARSAGAQEAEAGPRLLVLIAVDQLRGDLVEHYAAAFSGGFKRLIESGYWFTGASHAHAITQTAAGHATLATGVFPSRSGIVANQWVQRTQGAWLPMYSVEDPEAAILGASDMEGRSPRNLLRDGLADWLQAADPRARVVSLSKKDRAAITMAGKVKGHVYWLEAEARGFVTSEYYRERYPGWVGAFNKDVIPELLADSVWWQIAPEHARLLARGDSADYERGGAALSTFPHASSPSDWLAHAEWAFESPIADRAVSLLALEAIDDLELGNRGSVDFLALSFSATDHVGHAYGPFSQEQLDNLVRLDQELDVLFTYLDERVGRGRWVAAFSADHGVMTMPEYLSIQGIPAVRTSERGRRVAMGEALQGVSQPVGEDHDLAERLAEVVEEGALAAKAYTHLDLTTGFAADSFAVLFRNSYYPGRAAGWLSRFGLESRFGEHELVYGTRGTTHGSPYWHDRHVPLAFLGAGVQPGRSDRRVYTVDVAPTLAALGGIPIPDDLDGRVIYR